MTVRDALDIVDRDVEIVFRPHPTLAHRPTSLEARIARDDHHDLVGALMSVDVAVCGALSSASVESACLGTTTVLIADPRFPLTSPAEAMPSVVFATDAAGLARLLAAVDVTVTASVGRAFDVFDLQPSIPNWRGLVGAGARPL